MPGCATRHGTNTHQITAPTTPGAYDIRFNLRQDYNCGDTWWDSEPPAAQTIGRICVVAGS